MLIKQCICGSRDFHQETINGIGVSVCNQCSVVHQALDMSEIEYKDYYKKYLADVYYHDYSHDYEVAKKRADFYKLKALKQDSRILDVGCGYGAFVNVLRKKYGLDAYGFDVSDNEYRTEYIYQEKKITEVNFPTDYFDVITMHDVLEHLLNPIKILNEIYRTLKQEGILYIELPNFWVEEGKHHWKKVEHLWFFNVKQMFALLKQTNFQIEKVDSPIPSKLVFKVTKPTEKRTSILVPPGIGDVYWSLAKMKDFSEKNDLGILDVYISSPTNGHAPRRSFEYIQKAPFVNAAGYLEHSTTSKENKETFLEAYRKNGNSIFRNIANCDYFMAYNGVLSYGKSLDIIDDYKTDWFYPMFESVAEKKYQTECKKKYGDYFVAGFFKEGMYKHWIKYFGAEEIYQSLNRLAEEHNAKIILVGGSWDKKGMNSSVMEKANSSFIDLTGKTTLDEVFGLMRGAKGFVGFPSGLPINSVKMKKPTVMLWHDYFHSKFWWNSCAPASWTNWYAALDVQDEFDKNKIVNSFKRLFDEGAEDRDYGKATYEKMVMGKPAKSLEKELIVTQKNKESVLTEVSELTIASIYWGNWADNRGSEYVNKLYRSVKTSLTIPFRFVCFTDQDLDLEDNIDKLPLESPTSKGLLSKMVFYRPDNGLSGRVLALDLDTVIIGNIDHYAKTKYPFVMRDNFRVKGTPSGDMMLFDAGSMVDKIWKPFLLKQRYFEDVSNGDDRKIYEQLFEKGEIIYWQDLFPGEIYSYRYDILSQRKGSRQLPKNAKFVCFHGYPKQHSVKFDWVKENWK